MPMGRLDNVSHVIYVSYYLSPDPVSVSAGSPGGQPQHSGATPLHAAHHLQEITIMTRLVVYRDKPRTMYIYQIVNFKNWDYGHCFMDLALLLGTGDDSELPTALLTIQVVSAAEQSVF